MESPAFDSIVLEPDSTRFLNIEGVESIARVYKEAVEVKKTSRDTENVQAEIMAVNTKEFGETVNFKDTLLPEHINTYLNVLSTRADAVILSMNFHTKMGFDVGDKLRQFRFLLVTAYIGAHLQSFYICRIILPYLLKHNVGAVCINVCSVALRALLA